MVGACLEAGPYPTCPPDGLNHVCGDLPECFVRLHCCTHEVISQVCGRSGAIVHCEGLSTRAWVKVFTRLVSTWEEALERVPPFVRLRLRAMTQPGRLWTYICPVHRFAPFSFLNVSWFFLVDNRGRKQAVRMLRPLVP